MEVWDKAAFGRITFDDDASMDIAIWGILFGWRHSLHALAKSAASGGYHLNGASGGRTEVTPS